MSIEKVCRTKCNGQMDIPSHTHVTIENRFRVKRIQNYGTIIGYIIKFFHSVFVVVLVVTISISSYPEEYT